MASKPSHSDLHDIPLQDLSEHNSRTFDSHAAQEGGRNMAPSATPLPFPTELPERPQRLRGRWRTAVLILMIAVVVALFIFGTVKAFQVKPVFPEQPIEERWRSDGHEPSMNAAALTTTITHDLKERHMPNKFSLVRRKKRPESVTVSTQFITETETTSEPEPSTTTVVSTETQDAQLMASTSTQTAVITVTEEALPEETTTHVKHKTHISTVTSTTSTTTTVEQIRTTHTTWTLLTTYTPKPSDGKSKRWKQDEPLETAQADIPATITSYTTQTSLTTITAEPHTGERKRWEEDEHPNPSTSQTTPTDTSRPLGQATASPPYPAEKRAETWKTKHHTSTLTTFHTLTLTTTSLTTTISTSLTVSYVTAPAPVPVKPNKTGPAALPPRPPPDFTPTPAGTHHEDGPPKTTPTATSTEENDNDKDKERQFVGAVGGAMVAFPSD